MTQEPLQKLVVDLGGLDRTELRALRDTAADAIRKATPSGVLAQYVVQGLNGEPKVTYRLRLTSCGRKNCKTCGGVRSAHGPWWYSTTRIDGQRMLKYIGKTLPDEVVARIPELSGGVQVPAPVEPAPVPGDDQAPVPIQPSAPVPTWLAQVLAPAPAPVQRKIGRRVFAQPKTTTTTSHTGDSTLMVIKAGPGPKPGEEVTVYPVRTGT